MRVDKNLSQVTAPGSIKRACLNRVKYGQKLHERMDMLYTSSEDEIGPFCTKMGINKNWLRDHHQYDLEPGMLVTHMNFLGELKHPCRHDAQNDSEVRKITHTFSIKKN